MRQFAQIILCTAICAGAATTVCAQTETPSLRPLPLPAGDSASPQQHMQLLLQLKSLMSGSPDDSADGATENPLNQLSPEQLELLQKAVRSFAEKFPDAVPPNIRPPNMQGLKPEDVSRALEDPEMRETMKRLLEQFVRDRKLPQNESPGGPILPPLPGARKKSDRDPPGQQLDSERPTTPPSAASLECVG